MLDRPYRISIRHPAHLITHARARIQARAQAESSAIVAQAAQAAAIRHQQAVAAAQIQSQVRKRRVCFVCLVALNLRSCETRTDRCAFWHSFCVHYTLSLCNAFPQVTRHRIPRCVSLFFSHSCIDFFFRFRQAVEAASALRQSELRQLASQAAADQAAARTMFF